MRRLRTIVASLSSAVSVEAGSERLGLNRPPPASRAKKQLQKLKLVSHQKTLHGSRPRGPCLYATFTYWTSGTPRVDIVLKSAQLLKCTRLFCRNSYYIL